MSDYNNQSSYEQMQQYGYMRQRSDNFATSTNEENEFSNTEQLVVNYDDDFDVDVHFNDIDANLDSEPKKPIISMGSSILSSSIRHARSHDKSRSNGAENKTRKYDPAPGGGPMRAKQQPFDEQSSMRKKINFEMSEKSEKAAFKQFESSAPLTSRLSKGMLEIKRKAKSFEPHMGYERDLSEDPYDVWNQIIVVISYILLVLFFPFSLCTCIKVAQEYERAVIFRLGRIIHGGHKGPGIFFILPCVDTYLKVDLRTVTFDVPPQEILTKDSVTVSVDAVVYFRIFDAVTSVINVEDAAKSTKLLAASTLRNVLGTKSLHEILSDRETVATLIQNSLLQATSPWGVQVERVEVKDVRLPVQLQRAMATEAEAAREARAKVIAAEGEKKASVALKEAANVIKQSPVAIQLRYLQTLTQIASERNSTIVFPIPIELLSFYNGTSSAFGPITIDTQKDGTNSRNAAVAVAAASALVKAQENQTTL